MVTDCIMQISDVSGRQICECFDMPEVLAWRLSLMNSAPWSKGFHWSNLFIPSVRTWQVKRRLNADWSGIKPKLICPSLLCVSETGAQGSVSGLVFPGFPVHPSQQSLLQGGLCGGRESPLHAEVITSHDFLFMRPALCHETDSSRDSPLVSNN